MQAYLGIIEDTEPYSDIFKTIRKSCIYSHFIFRTLTHLESEASSRACRTCKITRHIQSPNIYRTLCKRFQGYLRVFRDTDPYSPILTGVNYGKGGRPLLLFFENQRKKKILFWKKKSLIMSIIGLDFPLKM